MGLNFRKIGKIGFLLVIIGFFMPLACDANGFQIAGDKLVDTSFSLLLYGLFVSAFAGIIIGILLLANKKVPVFIDWLIMLICMCCGLIAFFGTISDYNRYYQLGVYVILAGLAVALIAQIISIIFLVKEKSASSKKPPVNPKKLSRAGLVLGILCLILFPFSVPFPGRLLILLVFPLIGTPLSVIGRSKSKLNGDPIKIGTIALILNIAGLGAILVSWILTRFFI